MPIDTKPEEKIIYGAELEAAITDGIQRAIGRRVTLGSISVTVDVVGSLKGPKPGAKRKPRAKSAMPAT